MITRKNFKNVLEKLGFENKSDIYTKNFNEFKTKLKVDFKNEKLIYPENDGFIVNDKTTSNFTSAENFVVFECVCRLLNQGYNPKHIELEPKWQVGHGASGGKADILIKDNDNKTLLIIECKTAGDEFKKAWDTTQIKPTQLFSYAQQDRDTKFLALYTSDFIDDEIKSNYYLINLSDDKKRLFENKSLLSYNNANTVENIYNVWSETYKKEFKTNGIFEENKAYFIGIEKTNINDLKIVSSNNIKGKYNEFATIMRQHNIGGAERAFNVLVNLFLCKIIDENKNLKNEKSGLGFYWKGISYDNAFALQDRLQELYKIGMFDFLNEEITYISDSTIDTIFERVDIESVKIDIKNRFREQKFFTNNDFSFLDVHSEELFYKNFEVLLKVVKMFQDIRLTGVEDNQFLGDMFEGFLDNGVKQSEGQFFTPMPIVKFIINSLPLEDIQKIHDKPKAIDYACGAGHFLNEVAKVFSTNEVVGIEKEYRLSKVAKVSALMYGQENINIVYNDALTQNNEIKNNSFSVLVANPPYSVKGFLETLSKEDIATYELMKTIEEKSYTANNSIECFFVEKSKQLLSANAVAGIVLPSSILSKGEGKNTYVGTREILIKYFEIVAIAEFGSGTFGKTGTNTVTLFLKRRDDTLNIVGIYKDFVDNLFKYNKNIQPQFQDKNLIQDYCTHIDIEKDIYFTMFEEELHQDIFKNETFKEYQQSYNSLNEKLKKKTSLLEYIKNIESDKFYYFCLAKETQKEVLIIKAPSDGKANKKFLGYEWSGRKGNEGIQYSGGTLSSINTPLYNPNNKEDETKINSLISKNFNDENIDIPKELEKFVSKAWLVDMMDFSRKDFNKAIGLNPKKEPLKIGKSEWQVKLSDIAEIKKGKIITEIETTKGNIKVVAGGLDFAYYHNQSNRPQNTITISASGANAGFVNIWKDEIYASDCTTIISNNKAEQLYIYYLLKALQINIFDLARGSAQPHVYPSDIQNLKIPLPPLNIQNNIIKECKVIDKDVEKANEDINNLNIKINNEIQNIEGKIIKLGEITENLSNLRVPITQNKRVEGIYPYYGASGIVDYVDSYIVDDFILLISEDGANLKTRNTPIAFTVEGKAWVNNHAHIIKFKNKITHKLVEAYLNKLDLTTYITGQAQPKLNQRNLHEIKIPLPSIQTQKEIVSKIEELENNIATSQKIIDEASDKKQAVLRKYL